MKLTMDKELLRDVMKAMKGFSDSKIKTVSLDAMRGGIILTAMDADYESMMAIAVSKMAMAEYVLKDSKRIVLDKSAVKEIIEFCQVCIKGDEDRLKAVSRRNRLLRANAKKTNENLKKGEKKIEPVLIESPDIHDMTLEFDNYELKIHVGQLKRSTRLMVIEDGAGDAPADPLKTAAKVHKDMTVIGELNEEQLEELLNYMRAAYSFESSSQKYGDRPIRIAKDDKRFEIEAEIEKGDSIILDLNKVLMKIPKESLKLMFNSTKLYKALNRVSKITDRAVLVGKSDHPLLVSGTGKDPEDASKFKEDIDYWYLLAPKIEAD